LRRHRIRAECDEAGVEDFERDAGTGADDSDGVEETGEIGDAVAGERSCRDGVPAPFAWAMMDPVLDSGSDLRVQEQGGASPQRGGWHG
jgi:hypothetical protein